MLLRHFTASVSLSCLVGVLLTCSVARSQVPVTSTWDGTTGGWAETARWDLLGGADPYPDNNASFTYDVSLPAAAGAYVVTVGVPSVTATSLSVDGDASLLLTSTDFNPGSLTNAGLIEVHSDDLFLSQNVTNDGTITFDLDTGSEDVEITSSLTLGGTGSLLFPQVGSLVHTLRVNSGQTLTNAASHTIAGGDGFITLSSSSFINDGTVRANLSGRSLQLSGGTFNVHTNNGTMTAESGGSLEIVRSFTNNGTLSCDSTSQIRYFAASNSGSATIGGTMNIDGLFEKTSSATVTLDATAGSGTGEYLQLSGNTTFATGTTVEFGRVNVLGTGLTVQNGGLITVSELFTHSLTTETSHNFNATGGVRITGATAAGPTDFGDFAALEIAGFDEGNIPAGFTNNFHLPRLVIAPGAKVNLFDVVNNGNRNGPSGVAEALYVDVLEFEDATGLVNLNGHNLYFGSIVGSPTQLVDSGGGSGKAVVSAWTCTTANWSQTACWDVLAAGDLYPDNTFTEAYEVDLPLAGGAYTVAVDVNDVTLATLDVSADTTLLADSLNFDPGLLTNDGEVVVAVDDLFLRQSIVNDGVIRFDLDASSEDIEIDGNVTLNGSGSIQFPFVGSQVHAIRVGSGYTLTNSATHTIEGGDGFLTLTGGSFINDGVFRANLAGRTLQLSGNQFNVHTNNGQMSAENGATIDIIRSFTNNGTLSCDSTSTIRYLAAANSGTASLGGVLNIDGLFEKTSTASLTFAGASGVSLGEYRQNSGSATFATGTTAEFDRINIIGTNLTVQNGALVTATSLFTHSLTTESSHNFNATGGLRMTGGTAAGPTDFGSFAALEIAGLDEGDVPAGFSSNFQLPRLLIGPGAKVNLFDVINNGNRNGSNGVAEALYVETLEFEDASGLINLNGYNLYFNNLIGNAAQLVDSGGGSGKGVFSTWTCASDLWSQTTCWSLLAPGDSYPDNTFTLAYQAFLPATGSSYVVTMDVPVNLSALDVSADAQVVLTSIDFDPGALMNAGTITVSSDDLFLRQSATNDGVITYDLDTGSEDVETQGDVTLGGTGSLVFPPVGSVVHGLRASSSSTLTNGPNHTIEGGDGFITMGGGPFVNEGTVRANLSGRRLQFSGSVFNPYTNNGLMVAENGGILEIIRSFTNVGTISCDPGSIVRYASSSNGGSANFGGVIDVDGLFEKTSTASLTFAGPTGSGVGEYRQTSGTTTFATGTSFELGTVDIQSGSLIVQNGADITVSDRFSHSLTSESSHNFNSTGGVKVTGGVGGNPCDALTLATLEVSGSDQGDVPAGFTNNFQLPRLVIAAGAKLILVDDVDNGNRNGPSGAAEALYVDTLIFEDSAGRLVPDGFNVYFNTLSGDASQIGAGADCNTNLIPDECDIADGTSLDCNGNGVPDECDLIAGTSLDCNANQVPDECDITSGFSLDCQPNGVPDECDLAVGTSLDLNTNNTPDECENDCNLNAIPDDQDIATGFSEDCNSNGFPDECETMFDAFTWTGPDGGLFNDPNNWTPIGVPGGEATLSNAGATENRSVLRGSGAVPLCLLTIEGTGVGEQVLEVAAGVDLRSTGGTSVLAGARLELQGGTLGGGAVSVQGTLVGDGEVTAALSNSGTVSTPRFGEFSVTGASFDNTSGGTLVASFGSDVLIQTGTVTQQGAVRVDAAAALFVDASFVNGGSATLEVLGGAVGAQAFTNEALATISGFGTIQGDVDNQGDIIAVADLQIVGDLLNDGSLTIQGGQLTVTGSITSSGTAATTAVGAGASTSQHFSATQAATLLFPQGQVVVGGDFDVAIDDSSRFDLTGGELQLSGAPGGGVQMLELVAADVGASVVLPDGSLFSIGTLRIGPPATAVALVDNHDNTPGAGKETLYVSELILEPGTTLELNGCNIYYETITPADPFAAGSGVVVTDAVGGGDLIPIGFEAFVRGDCNADGSYNIADPVRLLTFLFPQAPPSLPLSCDDACDCNDDEGLDIGDVVCMLSGLFGDITVPPAAPHPACGSDPVGSALECAAFAPCP
ncbi:MAG: hypothetical protein AAF581_06845 [Planctomycetota bacterium]